MHPKKKVSSNPPPPSKRQEHLHIDLLDPQAYKELMEDDPPPTQGEILPYNFDDEDEPTTTILLTINGFKLEEALRQKALKCKLQDRSQAHPKWGPFKIATVDSPADGIVVINAKGKKAFQFPRDDYLLHTPGLSFSTEDPTTYTLLCYLGPLMVTGVISEAKHSKAIPMDNCGPFKLARQEESNRLISVTYEGEVLYSFDLATFPRPTNEASAPAGQQCSGILLRRLAILKPLTRTVNSTNSSTNRFAPLAEDDSPLDQQQSTPKSAAPVTRNQTNPGRSGRIQWDDQDKDEDEDANSTDAKAGQGQDANMEGPDEEGQPPTPLDLVGGDINIVPDARLDPVPPPPPIEIRLTTQVPELKEDDSDGEAACSGDEKSPPKRNLHDIASTPSTINSSATVSSVSTLSNPSTMIKVNSGQTLLSVEIQLQPDKEHLPMMLQELKNLLSYVQILDPTAVFVSRGLQPDNTPLPNLDSAESPHWPVQYASVVGWFQSSTSYVFKQNPITETQLRNRLETRRNRMSNEDGDKARKPKKANEKEDRGPTSVYVTLNLFSSLGNIKMLVESMNIDLRQSNMRISVKALQCWESHSKKMLCSVQSSLCTAGVKQLLLHRLKETEKKLCRHGRMDTLEWYDKPLPAINVTIRTIRELKLPSDPSEREQLSFDPFPRTSKFAYFLEASEAAWFRIEPLLRLMIETNDLTATFGPSACIMEVPEANPNIDKVRAHHQHGRISMGYNLATTIVECCDVQLYDYEVKVRMEEVEVLDENGSGTGTFITPKPPYARTTIRKELQRIRFNDCQIFHTAVMICQGPETGMSSVVVAYDPNGDLHKEKYEFARRTISSLSCFMFHWLKQCGYSESTRSRLMRSFYAEKAQLAPQSSWDPCTLTATSHFATKSDTYLVDNAKYDPYLRKQLNNPGTGTTLVDMTDTVRKSLLKSLGYKPGEKACDVGSRVSGVSHLTGDAATTGASTVNSETTQNRVLRTKEYAKQLAESKEQNAEQASQIKELRAQMQRLTDLLAGISPRQGTPPLSGSGATQPQDPGSGVAPQGS